MIIIDFYIIIQKSIYVLREILNINCNLKVAHLQEVNMKVGFVSLGCSKNLVDTEMMIGLLKNNKFEIVNDETQADI